MLPCSRATNRPGTSRDRTRVVYMPYAVTIIGIASFSVVLLVIPANRILTKLGLPRKYLATLFIPVLGVAVFIYLAGFMRSRQKFEQIDGFLPGPLCA